MFFINHALKLKHQHGFLNINLYPMGVCI